MNGRRGYPMPQGGAGYNPYSKYPDIAGLIDKFMQNMMMMKQMKQQRQQQMWQRGMREKEFGLQEQRLAQEKPPTQAQQKWSMADANVASGEWTPEQGETYKLTGKIPTPRVKYPATTAANVKKMFKITDEEWKIMPTARQGEYFKEFHLRSRPKVAKVEKVVTPEEERRKGATTRDKNKKEMADFYKSIPELIDKEHQIKTKSLRKMLKKQGGRIPTSQQGYRLDMPTKYNVAILNKKDGVATPEDLDIIAKYEAMFGVFKDRLLARGIDSFDKFMTSMDTIDLRRDHNFEKKQIKRWYDIYKR